MPYGFYVTDKGRELIDAAIPSESKVEIVKACFGSGGNSETERDYGITELKNQFYEKALDPETDSYKVDPYDPYSLYLKVIVPSEVTGTINEIGYKDSAGNLIFYGIVQERSKIGGELGKGIIFQYEHWIKLENGDVDKIEINVASPEYERVEQLVEQATEDFNKKLEEESSRLDGIIEQATQDFNINNFVTKEEFNELVGDKIIPITNEEIEEITGTQLELGEIVAEALSNDEIARLLDDDPSNDPVFEDNAGAMSKDEILSLLGD